MGYKEVHYKIVLKHVKNVKCVIVTEIKNMKLDLGVKCFVRINCKF